MSAICPACGWPVRTFLEWFIDPCFAGVWTPDSDPGHDLTREQWLALQMEEPDEPEIHLLPVRKNIP